MSRSKSLKTHVTFNQNKHNIFLTKPSTVGFMSVDVRRQYHSDLSQLKFLNTVTDGPTTLDLNHNIDSAVKRTTDDNEEKIDLLLQFILHNKVFLNSECGNLDFVAYRRTFIAIMCNAFRVTEPIIIKASLYKGIIYLCLMESPQDIRRKKFQTTQEKKFCAWGYKFEQYLLSDEPDLKPDIEKPVIENEEFSLVYKASLANLNLLYAAQIDGLLTTNTTTKKPPTNNFETNLNYVKSNNYVELKTNREICTVKQDTNFKHEDSLRQTQRILAAIATHTCILLALFYENQICPSLARFCPMLYQSYHKRRYKLLRCWCQCYLAALNGLYVGFRNDEGIVQRLQWFDTLHLPTYCKNEWNPQASLDYLHYFLTYIKECFKEKHVFQQEPISLLFVLNVDKSISVTEEYEHILPHWFTK